MMRSGIMFKQGDLVILPFPFTDLSNAKKRPAIIISNNRFNKSSEDVLFVAVTSNPVKRPFSISLSNKNISKGILSGEAKIKVDKLFCISQKIILKKFAEVKTEVVSEIKDVILKII